MSDAVGVAEDLGWKAGAGTAHGRVYWGVRGLA